MAVKRVGRRRIQSPKSLCECRSTRAEGRQSARFLVSARTDLAGTEDRRECGAINDRLEGR
jgi:hypothetical protein